MSTTQNPTGSPEKTAKMSDEDLRKKLTPEQYRITQMCGTEPAFHNAYWNEHRAGIYVDIVTGEPLFSSLDKFDSGSGWPSFTKPIEKVHVTEKTDRTFGMERTEVRSKKSDSHLGHLFDDGPGADAHALLHQLWRASLRSLGKDEGRRLRRLRCPFRKEEVTQQTEAKHCAQD